MITNCSRTNNINSKWLASKQQKCICVEKEPLEKRNHWKKNPGEGHFNQITFSACVCMCVCMCVCVFVCGFVRMCVCVCMWLSHISHEPPPPKCRRLCLRFAAVLLWPGQNSVISQGHSIITVKYRDKRRETIFVENWQHYLQQLLTIWWQLDMDWLQLSIEAVQLGRVWWQIDTPW